MSIVRENLLKHANYTPYCGADRLCSYRWPRTTFNGSQFQCRCGWESKFEPEFIEQYKAAQAKLRHVSGEPPMGDAGGGEDRGGGR